MANRVKICEIINFLGKETNIEITAKRPFQAKKSFGRTKTRLNLVKNVSQIQRRIKSSGLGGWGWETRIECLTKQLRLKWEWKIFQAWASNLEWVSRHLSDNLIQTFMMWAIARKVRGRKSGFLGERLVSMPATQILGTWRREAALRYLSALPHFSTM